MSTSVILSNPLSASIAGRIGLSARSYAVGETVDVPDATAKSLVGSGYARYASDPGPGPGPSSNTLLITGTPTDGSMIGYVGSGWAVRTPSQVKAVLDTGLADVNGLSAALALLAPKASPALTGTPTAPTASGGTNTTQLATTGFVRGEVAALVASSPSALDTLNELATALGDDANFATTMTNALAAKAPLASPAFTGIPTAPTAAGGTNSTQLATTAFVAAATGGTTVMFNVKTYGATGDGTTDDTAAIQSAVNAAAAVTGTSSGGAVVYFPPGTYKISDVITLGASKLTIQGAGIKSTWINQTGANKHGFSATNLREFTFRDFALNGTTSGTGNGVYLAATGSYAVFDCRFENIYVQQFGGHGVHTEDLCASVFSHVRVDTCNGDGFHLGDNGSSGLGGTSVTMSSCFANACTGSGYYLDQMEYSVLSGCASDSSGGAGYRINRSSGIALVGCGVEDPTGHGVWVTDGSTSIDLTACWATRVATTSVGFCVSQNGGSSVSRVVLTACRVLGGITPLASAKVDVGCQAHFVGFQQHPSAGITGTGVKSFAGHENTGLTSYGQAPVSGDEPFVAWVVDTSTYAFGASVAGDTVRRWAVRGDGQQEWGTGSTTRDTNLYRHASGLRTNNTFIAANLNVGSPSGEAKVYVTYADSQSTSIGFSMYETAGSNTGLEMIHLESTSASKRLLGARVSGDSSNRLVALTSGQFLWGSGSGSLDTNLYRSAADELGTDDGFSLKTAGKGLSVKEGANAKQGTAILVGGTVTVANTAVTATSRILLTVQSLGTVTAPKAVAVTARTAGTSFTITSADPTDTSVVAFEIFEPAA